MAFKFKSESCKKEIMFRIVVVVSELLLLHIMTCIFFQAVTSKRAAIRAKIA